MTPGPLPEPTGSRRLLWADLPNSVRSGIEDVFGRKAAVATSLPGGFSEGLAARLESADGRRVFAKAVDAAVAPAVGAFHRREIATAGALPRAAPAPGCSVRSRTAGGWPCSSSTSTGRSPYSLGRRTS